MHLSELGSLNAAQKTVAPKPVAPKPAAPAAKMPSIVAQAQSVLMPAITVAKSPAKVQAAVSDKAVVSTAMQQVAASMKASGTNTAAATVQQGAVVAVQAINSPKSAAAGGSVAVAKQIAATMPVPAAQKQEIVKAAAEAEKMKLESKALPFVEQARVALKADALVAAVVQRATAPLVNKALMTAPVQELAARDVARVPTPQQAVQIAAEKKDARPVNEAEVISRMPLLEAAPGSKTAIVSAGQAAKLVGDGATPQKVLELTTPTSRLNPNMQPPALVNVTPKPSDAPVKAEAAVVQIQKMTKAPAASQPFYKKPVYWAGVAAVVAGFVWWRSRRGTFVVNPAATI